MEQTFTITASEFKHMLDTHDKHMARIYQERVDTQLGRLGLVNVTDRPEGVPLPFPDATPEDGVRFQANLAAVQAGSPTPPAAYRTQPPAVTAPTSTPAQTNNQRNNTPWRTVNMNQNTTVPTQAPVQPQAPAMTQAPFQLQAPSPFAQGPVNFTAPATHGCEGTPAYRTVSTAAPTQAPAQAPAQKEHKYPEHDAHFAQILTNAGIPFTNVRVDLTRDGRTVVEVYADNATCKASGIAQKPDLFAWGRDLALVINGTEKGFRPYSPLGRDWFVNYAGVAVYIS